MNEGDDGYLLHNYVLLLYFIICTCTTDSVIFHNMYL